MQGPDRDRFADWMRALEARHLADLTFPEVARGLRALSSTYVERRGRIGAGGALSGAGPLSGAGKRAAFALFYGPLHHILVRHIVATLPRAAAIDRTLVDLGCGTGASSAAWAAACQEAVPILGVDRHRWALDEAARTFRDFGLRARTRLADIGAADVAVDRAAFLAAFALNELPEASRESLLKRLLERASNGDQVLIVEPLAGFVAPWWRTWASAFESAGGRVDEWRVRVPLPAIVAKLDRAAGLRHDELTGRSLSLNL
jgi:predicted RNA methylase